MFRTHLTRLSVMVITCSILVASFAPLAIASSELGQTAQDPLLDRDVERLEEALVQHPYLVGEKVDEELIDAGMLAAQAPKLGVDDTEGLGFLE